ncbi:MAG: fluoride efflux transporter CrcB [Planctomycetota bacterium]|jgi:CrcB protein|nr:fluoride efflux transporter CrcB [Planctomycetota bacterium]
MYRSILAVCAGACAGALSRWGLALALNSLHRHMPLGTLAVNVLGGFAIGVLATIFDLHPDSAPEWRLLLITGFLGAFTTFSAFSLEVIDLLRTGRAGWAFLTVALHLFGSLLCVAIGFSLVLWLRRSG